MVAVCHEIQERVSLVWCRCGKRYKQWGRRPALPCCKCAEIHARKASPGETGTEEGGSEGKRAKRDSRDGRGERKREKSPHQEALPKKKGEKAGIRHVFLDPLQGSRVRLSAASFTNPFQALSSGKRSTPTPCQWIHIKGAVSKPDVALLQQTAVLLHLVTFHPFS